MTETLLSEKNPLLKQVRRAVSRGSLTEEGFAIAESLHLLEEAIESDCEINAVIMAESARSAPKLEKTRTVRVPDPVFSELTSTETTQGIIALVRPPAWTLDQLFLGRSLVIVLDGIQDPGNAGAIVRAAEAFGATGVVFLKGTVNPYNPKGLRASAGSVFRLPIASGIDETQLLSVLDMEKITLYAGEPHAAKLASDADFTARVAIAIGSEGRGISQAIRVRAKGLRIPTSGVESLNAAVAAGVLLYEARRQRTDL